MRPMGNTPTRTRVKPRWKWTVNIIKFRPWYLNQMVAVQFICLHIDSSVKFEALYKNCFTSHVRNMFWATIKYKRKVNFVFASNGKETETMIFLYLFKITMLFKSGENPSSFKVTLFLILIHALTYYTVYWLKISTCP